MSNRYLEDQVLRRVAIAFHDSDALPIAFIRLARALIDGAATDSARELDAVRSIIGLDSPRTADTEPAVYRLCSTCHRVHPAPTCPNGGTA